MDSAWSAVGILFTLAIDPGTLPKQNNATSGFRGDLNASEAPKTEGKGLWERVGEMRSEPGFVQTEGVTMGTERQEEFLPVYRPRERTSAVSLAGSLGLPIMGNPVGVRSFLGEEGKRKRDDWMG